MSRLEGKPFLEQGKAAVHGLRRALAVMLESVGADPDEPQEISRKFDLDKTLTWRIGRVVREEDAWEAIQHIPRRPSFGLLIKAMERSGAPAPLLESVWSALDEFERFVEIHSGDRETLEIMSSTAAKRTTEKRLESFRKAGFQASSAIWGVRAKLQLGAQFLAPGTIPGRLSITTVCGFQDFRRLRANTPWTIGTMRGWNGDQFDDTDYCESTTPLMSSSTSRELGLLLPEFCTSPTPQIEIEELTPSTHRYILKAGEVGNTASADIFLGWAFHNSAMLTESFKGETGDHLVMLSTPVEDLVHDLYIHKDLAFAMNLRSVVYSQLPGGQNYPHAKERSQTLPVGAEISDLGNGTMNTTLVELPRYREMIELATKSLNCVPEDFHAFRYRLCYPPIPAVSVLRHPLLTP